jgi:hypothetical protein
MYFFPAHFMDHGIDGRMRKLIDQNGIIMMSIDPDFIRQGIAKEQRLVIKVELYVHEKRE